MLMSSRSFEIDMDALLKNFLIKVFSVHFLSEKRKMKQINDIILLYKYWWIK